MDDETTRRIDEAAAKAARQKETDEFLKSIKSADDVLKPIYNPEAFVMRDKAKAAAARGELPKSDCTHPLQYIQQFEDSDPSVARRGQDVNLFACGVCGCLLWFVDPWGVAINDR